MWRISYKAAGIKVSPALFVNGRKTCSTMAWRRLHIISMFLDGIAFLSVNWIKCSIH